MNRHFYRLTSMLVCVSIAGSLMAGCGKKEEKSGKGNTPGNTTQQSTEISYPVKSDTTLSYWVALNTNVSAINQNLGDTEFAKELTKKTGIKVKYIHPTIGQEKEQFNLMIASGDLPDIVEYAWLTFAGGPEKALKDGYIVKLNDTMNKYAPNLKKYLEQNPDVAKNAKTDSGNMFMFPFVRGDDQLLVYHGPMLRNDWLKELNLQVPATMDEWTQVLKAFKEKKGATAPLSYAVESNPNIGTLAWGTFIGAYGTLKGYYMENGKIKFGPMEPAYKEFLKQYRQWFAEGLLDKNFATTDTKILDANVTGGKSGATVAYNGGSLAKWIQAMKDKDPKFDLVAAPYPTLKKGETPKFGQMDNKIQGIGAAISSTSKNAELAARLLDYGYSKEGISLFNYGSENVSYTMENGKPKYTDLILKNPDKLPLAQAMGKYMRTYSGPFVQQKEYIDNYYQLQQQKDALAIWAKTDAVKYTLPPIYPLPEESSELAKVENEVNTYVDEMFYKFIMGAESLDNFDKYVEQIKKLNVEKAITIKQNALDRYSKR